MPLPHINSRRMSDFMHILTSFSNLAVIAVLFYFVEYRGVAVRSIGTPNFSESSEFNWSVYEDKESAEFWDKGGDGSSPRPFRYVAKYPTPENIAKLVTWLNTQKEESYLRAKRMIEVGEDLLAPAEDKSLKQVHFGIEKSNSSFQLDWQNIEIFYIYSSICSACQQDSEFIKSLENKGVKVTFLQTDKGKSIHKKSVPYSSDFKKFFPHKVTPTYFVRGQGWKAKLEGARDLESFKKGILNVIEKEKAL